MLVLLLPAPEMGEPLQDGAVGDADGEVGDGLLISRAFWKKGARLTCALVERSREAQLTLT